MKKGVNMDNDGVWRDGHFQKSELVAKTPALSMDGHVKKQDVFRHKEAI